MGWVSFQGAIVGGMAASDALPSVPKYATSCTGVLDVITICPVVPAGREFHKTTLMGKLNLRHAPDLKRFSIARGIIAAERSS